MARSRSSSFSDGDLDFIGSQHASQSQHTALPLDDANDDAFASRPAGASPTHPNNISSSQHSSQSPAFSQNRTSPKRKPQQVMSSLMQKAAHKAADMSHLFRQPTSRPEHHRPDRRPPPGFWKNPAPPTGAPAVRKQEPQMFSSLSANAHPVENKGGYGSGSGTGAYADQVFYTDPEKASADLKALLEGGMEDEEDDVKEEDEDEANKAALPVEQASTTVGQTESEAMDSMEPAKPKKRIRKFDDGTREGIKVKLLPHQVEGVRWMKTRESGPLKRGTVPKGGILADDMGLGKTLQSISLIISNPMPKKGDDGWLDRLKGVTPGTLVVAPLALIRQWEQEIRDRVTDSHRLKVLVHHGPNRTKDYKELTKYDVVITTYQILVSEHGHSTEGPEGVKAGCFGIRWYRIILDEAHTIKNRNAKSTKAAYALRSEYRWCLTGTPMQNNLEELQSLIAFLRIPPYDSREEWKQQIETPMKQGKGHIAIRRLHSVLRCFMKRRTKDILKEEGALLPGGKKALDAAKERGDEHIPVSSFRITERKIVEVSTDFSDKERKFYDALAARADRSLEAMMQKKVMYSTALVLLLRLRQACNHPDLVKSSYDLDVDALQMDTAQDTKKKGNEQEVDDLADALGGMDLETKNCEMCLTKLSPKDYEAYAEGRCRECSQSLAALWGEEDENSQEKPAKHKHSKRTKHVKEVKPRSRKPRANVLADSDDEEDEEDGGRWLVGKDQRGSLHLGKAGGSEDEDAEGGGEDVGSEDSIHHSEIEDDGSRLSSFVVDDEGGKSMLSDEASFVSIDKLDTEHDKHSQKTRNKLPKYVEENDSDDESGSSDDSNSSVDVDTWTGDTPGTKAFRNGKIKRPTETRSSAKIRETLDLLHKETAEHKFIIFSQFTTMLDQLEPFLSANRIKYTRYDGKMRTDAREEALNSLRNDKHTRVLLCSLKCGALGLNLTAATRVIILEPFWNPFVEEQAIDRVHRLTQTVDVVVYKITVKNTVEEGILALQEKKRLLAEHAIEGGMRKGKDKNAMKLGLEELMKLFKHDVDGMFGPQDPGSGYGGHAFDDVVNYQSSRGIERKAPKEKKVWMAPGEDLYARRW